MIPLKSFEAKDKMLGLMVIGILIAFPFGLSMQIFPRYSQGWWIFFVAASCVIICFFTAAFKMVNKEIVFAEHFGISDFWGKPAGYEPWLAKHQNHVSNVLGGLRDSVYSRELPLSYGQNLLREYRKAVRVAKFFGFTVPDDT